MLGSEKVMEVSLGIWWWCWSDGRHSGDQLSFLLSVFGSPAAPQVAKIILAINDLLRPSGRASFFKYEFADILAYSVYYYYYSYSESILHYLLGGVAPTMLQWSLGSKLCSVYDAAGKMFRGNNSFFIWKM